MRPIDACAHLLQMHWQQSARPCRATQTWREANLATAYAQFTSIARTPASPFSSSPPLPCRIQRSLPTRLSVFVLVQPVLADVSIATSLSSSHKDYVCVDALRGNGLHLAADESNTSCISPSNRHLATLWCLCP